MTQDLITKQYMQNNSLAVADGGVTKRYKARGQKTNNKVENIAVAYAIYLCLNDESVL